jgi:hypothetical protein
LARISKALSLDLRQPNSKEVNTSSKSYKREGSKI